MATMTNTAKLIFADEQFVSLTKIAQIICDTQGNEATVSEVSLTSLQVQAGAEAAVLKMAFQNDETVISLSLENETLDQAGLHARLATLLFPIAKSLPADFVIWAGTDLRIPRDTFVTKLAPTFLGTDVASQTTAPVAETEAKDNVTPIAPRRVACTDGGTKTVRPMEKAAAGPLAEFLPKVNANARVSTANHNSLLGAVHYDAHVKSYEENLRHCILMDADEEELEALREEYGIIPVEARLSAWAVSLTIATVSLPVAAPVMIYNVARGEDMRVASLAMALAGFFLALDSSGAMASVMSF